MSSLAQWTATQWTAAPSAALPPTPRTRRLIEHYEIGEAPRILGHGRYGPVIRARDVRTKRLVAIKVFDGSTLDEPARDLMRRQFATEAVALQRLSCDRHEGHVDEANAWACHLPACPTAVQQLLGYSHDGAMRPSQAEDGCCYLALELGDVTLAELGSAPLSAAEVRDAVQALFTTVAQLHGCGLVLARHSLHDFMRFGKTWKCIAATGLRPVGWEPSPSELSHLLFGSADGAPQPVDEATAVVPPACYLAPEIAAALLGGAASVPLVPSMDVWALTLRGLDLLGSRRSLQTRTHVWSWAISSNRRNRTTAWSVAAVAVRCGRRCRPSCAGWQMSAIPSKPPQS